jgi:porphobilinogen synthase
LGAEVLAAPAIATAAPDSYDALDAALAGAARYDWLALTSAAAVDAVADRLAAAGAAFPPAPPRVAAVGRATAAAARARLGRVDLVPAVHAADGLADALPGVRGARVLFPCADRARDALPTVLRARGARVDRVVAYRTVDAPADALAEFAAAARAGALDAVLVASPVGGRRARPRARRRAGGAGRRPPRVHRPDHGRRLPGARRAGRGGGARAHRRGAGRGRGAGCTLRVTVAGVSAATRPPREALSREALMSALLRDTLLAPPGAADAAPAAPAAARIGRLRRLPAARAMLAETSLRPEHLVLPLFVRDGHDLVNPIGSLPGHAQWSVDRLGAEVDEAAALGVRAVLLFGIPDAKDDQGTGADDPTGPVPRAARLIRSGRPACSSSPTCACASTRRTATAACSTRAGAVDLDATLPRLAATAVAYADAGVDVVAPSAMMDGQVAAIRRALDAAGHQDVPIMSYSTKFASAFYGPFRDAVGSAPAFGDRAGHQLPPGNAREAVRESVRDAARGPTCSWSSPPAPTST